MRFIDPGHVAIRRTPLAGATVVDHDVVDRTGRIVRRVALPNELSLVGSGRAAAYLVRTHADGLQ